MPEVSTFLPTHYSSPFLIQKDMDPQWVEHPRPNGVGYSLKCVIYSVVLLEPDYVAKSRHIRKSASCGVYDYDM